MRMSVCHAALLCACALQSTFCEPAGIAGEGGQHEHVKSRQVSMPQDLFPNWSNLTGLEQGLMESPCPMSFAAVAAPTEQSPQAWTRQAAWQEGCGHWVPGSPG